MPIIESCKHGHGKIDGCSACKKIYATNEHANDRAGYLLRTAKQRARKRNVPFSITRSDITVPTHCPVLGIALDDSDRDHTPSLDEVVQGLGYVPRNVCVISGRANRIKSDATLSELRAIEAYVRLRSVFALHGVPSSW